MTAIPRMTVGLADKVRQSAQVTEAKAGPLLACLVPLENGSEVPCVAYCSFQCSKNESATSPCRAAGKAAGIYGVEEAVVMQAARREPARTRG